MEEKRKTRGRQKIPMRLIENLDDRYACFSKRRLGLFKKAGELCTLCNVDIGIIIFSPTNNPFSYFSPTMDSILERYIKPDKPLKMTTRAIDAHTKLRIAARNKELDEVAGEKHATQKILHGLNEVDKVRHKAWWELIPISSLNKEQVREWTFWFQNFKTAIEDLAQQRQDEAFNQQLQDFSAPLHVDDYVQEPPFNPAEQVAGGEFYFGDEANQYAIPTLPLNLPDGGGGGQNYFGGGGGEGSMNAQSNPNYFNQPLPGGMGDGSSSSNDVFYPDQYNSYVSPVDLDPFLGEALEQYAFPSPVTGEQGGVGDAEQLFEELMAAAASNMSYFPDPFYPHLPTGAQDFSAAAETYQGIDY